MKTYRLLLLLLTLAPLTVNAFTITENAKLLAADGDLDDWFGLRVALDNDTALISAPRDDELDPDSGAAYIFTRDANGIWTEHAKLLRPYSGGGSRNAFVGSSVALEDDTALVGSFDRERVYVFVRDTDGVWNSEESLAGVNEEGLNSFGANISLDGDNVLVGSPGDSIVGWSAGAAFMFKRDATGQWQNDGSLFASDGGNYDQFGSRTALDGDSALIGAIGFDSTGIYPDSKVYAFARQADGTWQEEAIILAPKDSQVGRFGEQIALQGNIALISATRLNRDHERTGVVYVYKREAPGQWQQLARIMPPNGQVDNLFGKAMALADNTALVRGTDKSSGSDVETVYVYTRDPQGKWTRRGKLLTSDGNEGKSFGNSISLDGNAVLVGAPGRIENGIKTGAAYVYELPLAPKCNNYVATIYVKNGRIVGGPKDGQRYQGELIGTALDDVIAGTPYKDVIKGRGGNDMICGEEGQDQLYGGDGNDLLLGGDGRDILKGQDGDDRLFGNRGDDILHGGRGKDSLRGGWDHDRCYRGESNLGCEIIQ